MYYTPQKVLNHLNSDGYRKTIKALCDLLKVARGSHHGSYQKMASACGVQKSYLSKVFSEQAHLNDDQLFDALEFLRLDPFLKEAVSLRHALDRCYSKNRHQDLQQKWEAKLNEKFAAHRNLAEKPKLTDSERYKIYYQDPFTPIVHMLFLLKKFSLRPLLIVDHLQITELRLQKIIGTLIELKIIEQTKQGFVEVVEDNMHLPKDSSLQYAFQIFQRTFAVEKLKRLDLEKSSGQHYALNFTADDESMHQVHQLFREFLNKMSSIVKKADHKNAYQMVFDLNLLS